MVRLADIIDEDEPCGLSEGKQKCCLCGTFLTFLVSLITFCILISEYKNLLPDDQVVMFRGQVRSAVNGPGVAKVPVTMRSFQRKALVLNGTEWATIRNVKTNAWHVTPGPAFVFLDAWEDVVRKGTKTLLGRDEFVRIIDMFTGMEKISTGPMAFTPDVGDQGVRSHIVVEQAPMLTKDVGIVVRDRSTAELSLVSACTETPGPFFPSPVRDIVETRQRLHIAPHQALLVQDIDGRTEILSGANPPARIEGNCDNTTGKAVAGGFAFFLPPLSRVVRMKWSDYSKPQEKAANFTTTPQLQTSTRRRRTSKSRVVLAQEWDQKPETWLVGGDYDPIADLWVNRGTGGNVSDVVRSGAVAVSTTGSNAPTAQLVSLVGGASTVLELGSFPSSSRWTLCSLSRYTGGSKRSVIAAPGGWAHGHYRGFAGVARYGYNTTDMISDIIRPDTEWVPMCSTSGKAPDNVRVYDMELGVNPGESLPLDKTKTSRSSPERPSRLFVNVDRYDASDFALAEVIVWNTELSYTEVTEVMDYFRARLNDAATYIDQAGSEDAQLSDVPRKDVTGIDLRTQKAFYKFQVRTSDNLRMILDGTIFWQVEDPAAMLATTSDPEGDVWSKCRSVLLDAVSRVAFRDFMSTSSELLEQAYQDSRNDTFWTERGLSLVGLEMSSFEPIDARTIVDLRTLVAQRVERIVKLTKQTSESEVRRVKIAADIALESNRTSLIQVKAENTRLEAQTRGATEGERQARGVAAFISGLASMFPAASMLPVELYEHYIILASRARQAQVLFNGRADVFIKPKATNVSLLLPVDSEAPALPRTLQPKAEALPMLPPPPATCEL